MQNRSVDVIWLDKATREIGKAEYDNVYLVDFSSPGEIIICFFNEEHDEQHTATFTTDTVLQLQF